LSKPLQKSICSFLLAAKGDDGYHDLATVFQAVSLYDEITVTHGENGSGITLRFSGENPHIANLPTNNKNLAYKAAQLFAQRKKVSLDLVIEIRKQIPIAGGMAGGSANAAGVLVALDSLYETKMTKDELITIARQLGSDVPFSSHRRYCGRNWARRSAHASARARNFSLGTCLLFARSLNSCSLRRVRSLTTRICATPAAS